MNVFAAVRRPTTARSHRHPHQLVPDYVESTSLSIHLIQHSVMKPRKSLFAILCCGFMLAGSLTSCTVRPVATRPAPPPARVEVIPVAPRGRYAWSPGYHRYTRRGYVWVPGRYVRVR